MELIADILLVAGAIGASFYCYVLARRLSRFNDLEKGVGGAVAVLSVQVDDLARALQQAQSTASTSEQSLRALTERSETVSQRLELVLASMHDMPESTAPARPDPVTAAAPPPPPKPKGEPMFMRHARSGNGAAG